MKKVKSRKRHKKVMKGCKFQLSSIYTIIVGLIFISASLEYIQYYQVNKAIARKQNAEAEQDESILPTVPAAILQSKYRILTEDTKIKHPIDERYFDSREPLFKTFYAHYKNYINEFQDSTWLKGFGEYFDAPDPETSHEGEATNSMTECQSYLSGEKGSWTFSDFTRRHYNNNNTRFMNIFKNIHFNPNTTLKQTLNQNGLIRWDSNTNCQQKVYNPYTLKQCLSENFQNIQVYGDSRGRQFWDAFRGILAYNKTKNDSADSSYTVTDKYEEIPTNGFYMNDGHWPPSDIISVNHNDQKISLRYDSYMSVDGVKEHIQKVYPNKLPKVIVILEQVLHQLRGNETEIFTGESERIYREELMPYLKERIADTDPDTVVVFFECEHVEVNGHGDFKRPRVVAEKNVNIKKWNDFLKDLAPDLGTENQKTNFYRISANLKTVFSPVPNTIKSLLTEGIHLGWKRVGNVVTAQPLLVDVNIFLNLLCNRFEDEEYCCSGL